MPDLDTVISEVEVILRLRGAVRGGGKYDIRDQSGKIRNYARRSLEMPLPGEVEDWQERRELLAETPNA